VLRPRQLLGLLAPRPALRPGTTIPRLETEQSPAVAAPWRIARLRRLLGLEGDTSPWLPLTFPHIAAFAAQLGHLADPRLPWSPLGLVHLRNEIVQRRPIAVAEPLRLRSWIEGHRDTAQGAEFDMQTAAFAGDELVWSSTSTMLARLRSGPKTKTVDARSATGPAEASGVRDEIWRLTPSLARAYALVSGDLNPIHLSWLTARLLGFPAPLMHGMWTIGRIAASHPALALGPLTLTVHFKLPILLPAEVVYRRWPGPAGGLALRVLDKGATKPHLIGTIRPSVDLDR
jgi:hypothetical protein